MKRLFSLLLLITPFYTVVAQDLIVTQKGDSINAKITKITKDRIYFTFRYEGEVRRTLVLLDKVMDYRKGYYAEAEVFPEDVIKPGTDDFVKLALRVRGGWSYRTGRLPSGVPSETREHLKGLRSGYHIGADLAYYFSETTGTGLKYSLSRFQDSSYGSIDDDITLQYIGPAMYGRLISASRNFHFTYDLSVGYLHYQDEARHGEPITYSGAALGFSTGIGVDFRISKQFFLGFEPSWNTGILNKVKINGDQQTITVKLEDDERENLSRLDLSARVKWNF